jgi:hypothetical protein
MYGEGAEKYTIDDVITAAKLGDCHDFIQELPKKYDTELAGSVSQRPLERPGAWPGGTARPGARQGGIYVQGARH